MATLCYFDFGYLANMKRENKALANRIQVLNQRTGFYQKQMKALVQREVESRIIAGLPEIHPDIRKLGIGGEGPPLYSNMDTDTLMILTDRIQIDLDRLLRQVRLEQASFVSVAEKVKEDNRIRLHLPTIQPVAGRTTSRSGMRSDPMTGFRRMHSGVDIAARHGNDVQATAAGVVVYTGLGKNYGKFVDIDHQNGYTTRYGHLSRITIQKNTQINRGDIIGLVGKTGRTTGYHLHYEIRRNNRVIDPLLYFYPEKQILD